MHKLVAEPSGASALPILSRSIVFVGLMGAGKSAIGRRLAQRLGVPFVDADHEIEAAAGRSIEEIFETMGEQAFRDGERKIMQRLLGGPVQVIATGGGAFMNPDIRVTIKSQAISIWLDASIEILLRRVGRRTNRPLLKNGDPRDVLIRLMAERNPVYAEADIRVESIDGPPETTVERVIEALRKFVAGASPRASEGDLATVRVELGSRGYDIRVGPHLYDRAGALVRPVLSGKRIIVVTDENVARDHWPRLSAGLAADGLEAPLIALPPGETTKDFQHLEELLDRILDLRPERGATLLAFGGGVIGDLTGLAASMVLRGIDFIQAPTTLLAQVDSAIGGKTGINTRHGKNLVGTFHQPRLVLADLDTLATLPRRELLAGYAEVVKYGLIDDPAFFVWLEENGQRVIGGESRALGEAVVRSARAKARVIAADEREAGRRALLNLGHTFGHALEAATGFGQTLLHGEAVAIGLVLAFDLSARLGLCPAEDALRVRQHIATMGLPASPPRVSGGASLRIEDLVDLMGQDKKVRDGRITFVLARGIGRAFLAHEVDPQAVRATLERALAA